MKKVLLILSFVITSSLMAQSKTYDISVSELPSDVKTVLEEYVDMLRSATSLDDMASQFTKIAGGGLVNEDPSNVTLRSTIKPYSLKKDFQNIKFYAYPIKITRVNSNPSLTTDGYGESAIYGRHYKIWIDKASGQPGMPAPISIMVPDSKSIIKSPKIVGIGSL